MCYLPPGPSAPTPVTVWLSRGKLSPFPLGSIPPGLGRVPGSGGIAGISLTAGSALYMVGHTHLPTTQEASLTTCLASTLAKASRVPLSGVACPCACSPWQEALEEKLPTSPECPPKAGLKSTPQIKGCCAGTCGRHVCRDLHTQLGTRTFVSKGGSNKWQFGKLCQDRGMNQLFL